MMKKMLRRKTRKRNLKFEENFSDIDFFDFDRA